MCAGRGYGPGNLQRRAGVAVGAREAAGGAAAQARSRGSATTEGSVNGLNPRPRYPPGGLVARCPSGSVVQKASESRAGTGA